MERDIRDPATIGQALLDIKRNHPGIPMSQIADGKVPKPRIEAPYCDLATDSGHSSANGLNGSSG